jgi:hypothetical protein
MRGGTSVIDSRHECVQINLASGYPSLFRIEFDRINFLSILRQVNKIGQFTWSNAAQIIPFYHERSIGCVSLESLFLCNHLFRSVVYFLQVITMTFLSISTTWCNRDKTAATNTPNVGYLGANEPTTATRSLLPSIYLIEYPQLPNVTIFRMFTRPGSRLNGAAVHRTNLRNLT